MTLEDKRRFLINTTWLALIAALGLFILKYVLGWILPLLLGFGIAFLLKPVVNMVWRFSNATRRFCAAIVLLLAYALLAGIIWLLLLQLVSSLQDLILRLPVLYSDTIVPSLERWNSTIQMLAGRLSPDLSTQVQQFTNTLSEQLSLGTQSLSESLIDWVGELFKRLPQLMLTFFFTILSSFFISMDYSNVTSFFARLVPQPYRRVLFELKDFFVTSLWGYVRAYLLLLLLTLSEVWIGLALLGVPGSGWWALLVALADLLPAVGTGIILLPWAVFALAQGDQFLGLGLLALYGVITVIRSLIEPKIVGDQIGLPPLATITAMFLGLKLLGVAGMFIAPLLTLMLKFLHDSGHIHLWSPPMHSSKGTSKETSRRAAKAPLLKSRREP